MILKKKKKPGRKFDNEYIQKPSRPIKRLESNKINIIKNVLADAGHWLIDGRGIHERGRFGEETWAWHRYGESSQAR
jgi:hypothetical protein